MIPRSSTIAVAALLAAVLGLGNIQPARADGAASTRNIILGAAVLATGIIISANVAHKRELANTVAGYTADGATVYADGRVVYPDGRSYYPNDNNQSIACRANSCTIFSGDGSNYRGYNRWNGTSWATDGGAYANGGGSANGGYVNGGYANGGGYSYTNGYRGSYSPGYEAYLVAYRDYLREYDAYVRAYYEAFNRALASHGGGYRYASPAPPPAPRPYCCDPNGNPFVDGRN